MSEYDAEVRPVVSWRTRLRWLPLVFAALAAALFSIAELTRERLFLFPMPVDRGAAPDEFGDAANTARTWIIPALILIAFLGATIIGVAREGPIRTALATLGRIRELGSKCPALVNLFALACLADAYTTWAYAQRFSIADELHPAIKLFAYAYGLTVGVFLGKTVQAGLVLVVAAWLPRVARTLLLVTTAGYAVAAAWNHGWS